MSEPPKRYSDEDAARILERAAELQQRDDDCVSLAELEASAHEVGIEASVIREAARELETGKLARRPEHAIARVPDSSSLPSGFAGAPIRLHVIEHLHGSMQASLREQIFEDLHAHFGELEPHHGDNVWRWKTSRSSSRNLNISVRPRGNKLVLRIEERNHQLAGSMYGGILGGVGGGGIGLVLPLAIKFASWLAPFVVLAWIATVFFIVRYFYSLSVRHRHQQLQSIAHEIASTVDTLALDA